MGLITPVSVPQARVARMAGRASAQSGLTNVRSLPVVAAASATNDLAAKAPARPLFAAALSRLTIPQRLLEVDGLKLDGIPYFDDAAVLLDDLPLSDPTPQPPTAGNNISDATASARQADIGQIPDPPADRSDAERKAVAERGYSSTRMILKPPDRNPYSQNTVPPDRDDPCGEPFA